MPRRAGVQEAVAAVLRLGRAHPDRTVHVGIDGFGGAGKTTLAAAIAATDRRITVVHVDDFSRPGVAEWEWDRFERQVVAPLRDGRPARYQVWDWTADSGGDWVSIPPGRIVITEGVSSTRREVTIEWDLTIWVDTARETRLRRAIERDGPAMLDTWSTLWIPSEQAYADREQPQRRVDLVISGSAAGPKCPGDDPKCPGDDLRGPGGGSRSPGDLGQWQS